MYCLNCGADVPRQARFCPSCGAPADAGAARVRAGDDETTRLASADETTRLAAQPTEPNRPARPAGKTRHGANAPELFTHTFRAREVQPQTHQGPRAPAAQDADAERVIFSVRPTFLFIGIGYALAALAAVALTALIAQFNLLPATYSLLVALPLLLLPAYRHLRRNSVKYTLTDAKIELDQGLLARRTRNIPLRNIQDVTVSATLAQRLLGFGDLVIDNASELGGSTLLRNIPNPRRHADLLLRELRRWN